MTAFKKKVLAFALAGTFALSQTAFVNAAVDTTETTNINKYDTVRKEMNLIQGDGKQVDLHKQLERYRAFVLYARMLGMADELQEYIDAYTTGDNFTDAAGKSPYVQGAMAFFKEKELSEGGSKGEFGPHDSVTGQQFYKMMLEALGYEQDVDFTYAEVADKALEIGLITDVEIAGTNELEEIQIGAALYDTLNANVKPAADAAADAPGVKLAYQLAVKDASAVPYLAALDKVAPTLTVTEPHAIGSRNPGIADGTTATDVTASATVDMPGGMPLQGTLSEPGTIYYDFNGVTGSFPTDADGKFDTTKLATPLEGTVDGHFPFITNNAETKNNNVVKMWAKDLAGNETKVLNWAKLSRTTEFNAGGSYTLSGSSIGVVTGSSVDFYFTVDMDTTPTLKVFVNADDKVGADVTFKAVTAAEVPTDLVTKLSVGTAADVKAYKATINLPSAESIVKLGGTSGKDFGSVTSINGKKITFVSKALTALSPTVVCDSTGGIKLVFNTEIDPESIHASNFQVDGKDAKKVLLLDDKKTVYLAYPLTQTKTAKLSVKGVRTADNVYTMNPIVDQVVTITDTTNPVVEKTMILAPNRIRLYLSEPLFNDSVSDVSKYTFDGKTKAAAVTNHKGYIDVTAFTQFSVGDHTLSLSFTDDAMYPFTQPVPFSYLKDVVAPTAEIVKATNNYVTVKFNEIVNTSTINSSNMSGAYAVTYNTANVDNNNANSDDYTRGLQTATYYFKSGALVPGTTGQVTIGGVKDLSNNVMVTAPLSAPVVKDVDNAKIDEAKIDGAAGDTTESMGTRTFKVTFTRPVLANNNNVRSFKITDPDGKDVPVFMMPDGGSAARYANGQIFGYKAYTVTFAPKAGDYKINLLANTVTDAVSGTVVAEDEKVITVKNERIPAVTKMAYDANGKWLYVSYNVPMDEASATNLYNYVVATSPTSVDTYLTRTDDSRSIEVSSDSKTFKFPSVLPANAYQITARGVKSVTGVLIDVKLSTLSSISVVGGIGSTPTLTSATSAIVAPNKLKVTLGSGTILNGMSFNDIGVYAMSSTILSDTSEHDLVSETYPLFTVGTANVPDANGVNQVTTTITYEFNRDIFTVDGKIAYDNKEYQKIQLRSRDNAAYITATNEFGVALANASSNMAAVPADKVSPSLVQRPNRAITDSGSYVIYLGFNENLTSNAALNFSLAVQNNTAGVAVKPTALSTTSGYAIELVNDNTAWTAIYNGVYGNGAVYGPGNTYGKHWGDSNVVKITIDASTIVPGTSFTVSYVAAGGIVDMSPGTGNAINSFDPVTVIAY